MCGPKGLLLTFGSVLHWAGSQTDLGSMPVSCMDHGLAWSKLLLLAESQIPHLRWKLPAPEGCFWDFYELNVATRHAVDPWKAVVRFWGAVRLPPSAFCWCEWAASPSSKPPVPGGRQAEVEEMHTSSQRSPGSGAPWELHRAHIWWCSASSHFGQVCPPGG